jgi:DnaJ-domain-containing protein 1
MGQSSSKPTEFEKTQSEYYRLSKSERNRVDTRLLKEGIAIIAGFTNRLEFHPFITKEQVKRWRRIMAEEKGTNAPPAENVPDQQTNYYAVLGVSRKANQATIRKAFRQMSLKYHPDRNQNNPEEAQQKQIAITLAYEVLSDPEKRRIYDASQTEFFTSGSSVNGLVSLLVLGGVYLVLKKSR